MSYAVFSHQDVRSNRKFYVVGQGHLNGATLVLDAAEVLDLPADPKEIAQELERRLVMVRDALRRRQ